MNTREYAMNRESRRREDSHLERKRKKTRQKMTMWVGKEHKGRMAKSGNKRK